MSKRIGYKVLQLRKNGTMFSFNVHVGKMTRNIGKSLRYFKNKKTVPMKGCGPIAIFSKIDLAVEFAKRFTDFNGKNSFGSFLVIHKCEYNKSKEKRLYIKGRESIHDKPNGTVLADSVIIKERIWSSK